MFECVGNSFLSGALITGPKGASEGVRVDKIRLGPDDINLQTEKIYCNYSVLIGSPE